MNGPVPGRVLVYLLSRPIGSRDGNVIFFFAAAELGSIFGRFLLNDCVCFLEAALTSSNVGDCSG